MTTNVKEFEKSSCGALTYERVMDEHLTVREMAGILWECKIQITLTMIASVFLSIVIALYLPNVYRSEVLLAPASSESSNGLNALAGQFGGLASMAGLSLNGGQVDKKTIAIQVLKSKDFLSKFIKSHNILLPLMAAEGWDLESDSLIYDNSIYDVEESKWVRKIKPPRGAVPSDQEAVEKFLEILTVHEDKETSLVSVSIDFYSPHLAYEWVSKIVEDINYEMKVRDLAEAEKSIEYLTNEIQTTRLTDMRSVLYQLVEEQTKTVMFAKVRKEYVFKTVESAVSSELPIKPKRLIIVIVGLILGLVFGIVTALIRKTIFK